MEKYNNYIRNKSFSQLANTGKTPDAVIQPTSNEHTNYNNRINRRKMQIGFDIALRNIGINKIKSKQQSKKIGNVSGRLGFLVSETIHNPPKKQLLCYTRQISPLDCYAYLIFEPKTKYISKILEAYG